MFQNKSVILCETGYLEILWTHDYCPGEDTLRNSFKTNQITYLHVLQDYTHAPAKMAGKKLV